MGVPGLWPILGQAGTLHNLETLDLSAVTDGDGDGRDTTRLPIVGVDISAWLYHARLSVEGSNPMLRLIFFRLARLLSLPIHVVFVFDGPLRPRIKRGRTVGAGKHPLTGPLMEMIAAFGGVGWEAPGEAEAELSRMNCAGLVDAVLSDDVDSLVFGARAIMRNWSATLSGSKSAAAPSSDEHGDNSVTIYKASHIQDLPDLGVDRHGLILVALLAGGDYDVNGLGGCGAKIAVALAQAGHGAPLVDGFKAHCKITGHDPNTNLPTVSTSSSWPTFLQSWLSDVREELSTNKQGFLHNKQYKLSRSDEFAALLGTPEALQVLASYIHPVTTWSVAEEGAVAGTSRPASRPPRRLKFREPNMKAAATYAQRTFAWGPKATVGRMRNVIWKGLLVREMRRLQIAEAQDQINTSDTQSRYPLVTIHLERRHPATGNLLEYRVEWDPTPLAKAAQEGIDPLLNVGPGFDEPYPDDYVPPAGSTLAAQIQPPMSAGNSEADDSADEDERPPRSPYELVLATGQDDAPPSPKKRIARPPPDPFSTVRSWILAERLELCGVGKRLVQEYKTRLANKGKAGSKKRTLPRSVNQPAIDGIFAAEKAGSSNRAAGSSKSKSALGTSPPTYRQTHLSFGGSRTFGRTQSGPAASASSDVDREPIGRRERAGSFDTLLEESFQMMSDSESDGDGDGEGDGFQHLRAVQSSSRIPLAEKGPAAPKTTRTESTRSTQSKSRSRSPVPAVTTATQFSSSTATQRKAQSRPPVSPPPRVTQVRPPTTRRARALLSSSPPPASRDEDDSLPDASAFLRQARAQAQAGRPVAAAPPAAAPIELSPSPRRPTSSSSSTLTPLSPSPRRPSSSKRPRNAGALPFLPVGKPTTKAPARPRATKPKGPPDMYPSSSSCAPVDVSSSPPTAVVSAVGKGRKKGGRKSDAIVLSDSE